MPSVRGFRYLRTERSGDRSLRVKRFFIDTARRETCRSLPGRQRDMPSVRGFRYLRTERSGDRSLRVKRFFIDTARREACRSLPGRQRGMPSAIIISVSVFVCHPGKKCGIRRRSDLGIAPYGFGGYFIIAALRRKRGENPSFILLSSCVERKCLQNVYN